MKRTTRWLAIAALAITALPAGADPLLGQGVLPDVSARLLAEQARLDRRVHPEAWSRVMDLPGLRPEVYLGTRGRRPSVAQDLRQLGPAALLPLLELLAGDGYPRQLDEAERSALTVGALEALGALRDRRASGVFRTAFARLADPDARLAAARGIAALGSPDDFAFLTTHLDAAAGRGLAALEGLGASRTPAALQVVATVLDATRDEAAVRAAARALGEIGSSWAQAAAGTDPSLPDRAAEPLVRAYLRSTGRTREAVQVAILSTHAPRATSLLRAALPTADAATRAQLTALLAILQR